MARRVSKEVKEEILSKVKAGEHVVDLLGQSGVSTKTIFGWLCQYTGEAVVSTLEYNQLKRENEERKRLMGELTLNRHLQKKVEIVCRARNKTVWADALGLNRKTIDRQRRQPPKDLVLKQPIEAVHRAHPADGQRRIASHFGIHHNRVQRGMALFKLRPPRRTTRPDRTRSTRGQ